MVDFVKSLSKAQYEDICLLQKDLDKLGQWGNEWCMKFHPDKCTVLRVTNKKKIIDAKYQLHGHTLESVTYAKYLCLTFTSKLLFVGYSEYCAFIRVEFHAPFISPMSQLI
jgi:hypothetical protein